MIQNETESSLAVIEADHYLVPTTAIETTENGPQAHGGPFTHAGEPPFPVPDDEYFGGRTYLDAPRLAELAADLIDTKPRFTHLRSLDIDYLWKRKGARKSGQVSYGQARLVSDLIGHFTDSTFVVMLSADVVRELRFTKRQVEAALHHELLHCGVHPETNAPMLCPHDFEGFALEIESYGLWTSNLEYAGAAVQRQLRLFPDGVR